MWRELIIKHHPNIRNAEATFSATVLKNMRILHLRLGHFSERKIYESIAASVFLTMYSRPLGWCVVQTPNWPWWTIHFLQWLAPAMVLKKCNSQRT